jgi:hypothetical protein
VTLAEVAVGHGRFKSEVRDTCVTLMQNKPIFKGILSISPVDISK